MPIIEQPTADGDGRFHASFRWLSVEMLTRVLSLVRRWYDDAQQHRQGDGGGLQRPDFTPEEVRLISIGKDLLGGFRDLDGKPRSDLLRDAAGSVLPTAQWLLPWQLRVVAGARLNVSFAAKEFAEGSRRLSLELLKHTFGTWAPWAAIESGGCGVRVPYVGPAILELQGLHPDDSSRDSTLLDILNHHRSRLHRIVLFPFTEQKMEVNRNVVRASRTAHRWWDRRKSGDTLGSFGLPHATSFISTSCVLSRTRSSLTDSAEDPSMKPCEPFEKNTLRPLSTHPRRLLRWATGSRRRSHRTRTLLRMT